MRFLYGMMTAALLLIGVTGMGIGVWLVAHSDERTFVLALAAAPVPFTVGMLALCGGLITGLMDEMLRESTTRNDLLREMLSDNRTSPTTSSEPPPLIGGGLLRAAGAERGGRHGV